MKQRKVKVPKVKRPINREVCTKQSPGSSSVTEVLEELNNVSIYEVGSVLGK